MPANRLIRMHGHTLGVDAERGDADQCERLRHVSGILRGVFVLLDEQENLRPRLAAGVMIMGRYACLQAPPKLAQPRLARSPNSCPPPAGPAASANW